MKSAFLLEIEEIHLRMAWQISALRRKSSPTAPVVALRVPFGADSKCYLGWILHIWRLPEIYMLSEQNAWDLVSLSPSAEGDGSLFQKEAIALHLAAASI
ncbi:hypothetical protein AK812_SmicGene11833 [Symbiodinium microadriaticum]|uniref:Uncharacterized protein n=1 Tax=Symbiodinium microadriaticum TaxID=2951 RepID=A0A1Q9EC52_SYMMI|nr:hypothetical protein AK812_SmicGene11833 [Symbiodinium microadriaticum]